MLNTSMTRILRKSKYKPLIIPFIYRENLISSSRGFSKSKNFEDSMAVMRCGSASVRSSYTKQPKGMSTLQSPSVQETLKPSLLESKVSGSQEFFGLSDGFKKIFANDKKDKKIVIPICGYGGHRRGDRSQNYFGKSFRDVTIQSRGLQRSMKKGSSIS